MIDLIERFEAEQRAREAFVFENGEKRGEEKATKKERILAIKGMLKLSIPLENIATIYNMTVEQVNELLNDSSH